MVLLSKGSVTTAARLELYEKEQQSCVVLYSPPLKAVPLGAAFCFSESFILDKKRLRFSFFIIHTDFYSHFLLCFFIENQCNNLKLNKMSDFCIFLSFFLVYYCEQKI